MTNMKKGDSLYISQQKIADQSVLLAYVNITLWHGGGTKSLWWWMNDIQGTTIEKAVTVTKYLNMLRTTDALSLQQKNPDGTALATLIQQGNTLVQQANILISPLNSIIQEEQTKLSACTSQKKQADDQYNQALKNYNSVIVEQTTKKAQEASTCMSIASVAMNSAKGVLWNMQSELTKTQKYLTLLTTNTSLLVQYSSVLDTDIPWQLVQLKKDLANL